MNALARGCLTFAKWLLRKQNAEWARAMQSEFQYVDETGRLSWAAGCVVAAIKQRWAPMDTGNLRVSRAVMLIETLGCFGFLTLGWYEITFGGSGLARLNGEIIEKAFFSYPGGPYIFWMMIGWVIVGLLGPIGLFFGLRYVLKGQALANRTLGWSLVAANLCLSAIGTIAGYYFGPADFQPQPGFLLLLTVMPVVGVLHLMHLAQPSAPRSILAAA